MLLAASNLRWRVVLWLVYRMRRRILYPLGSLIDRADRALLRLSWKAVARPDDGSDGVPF